jgi:hypothetical protein
MIKTTVCTYLGKANSKFKCIFTLNSTSYSLGMDFKPEFDRVNWQLKTELLQIVFTFNSIIL